MTDAVYLDHAATTPVRPEVLEAMLPHLSAGGVGNPSSSHAAGRRARAALDHARRQIADALGCEANHVLFTSGGTEADNLAVIGGALAARDRGRPFRVAVSAVEHPAVMAAARAVQRMGGEAIVLPVDIAGRVETPSLDEALRRGVGLVSAMWVNNEVGTVEDVAGVAARCREAGTTFHTDAVQAVGKVPCRLADVACTLLSISGHKIGAPQGVGALVVRDHGAVEALSHGGHQQFGLRPGTENVPGAVALGCAVALAVAELDETAARLAALREAFETRLLDAIPDAAIIAGGGPRAPHISNVAIPGIESDAVLMHLDLAGIACSAGSACHSGSVEPSAVLTALGLPAALATRALRFSFHKQNTMADVDRVIEVLPGIVATVRKLSSSLER